MHTLIDTYRSFPGEHCGSVAMRGLLNHYCGIELSEDAVFGLGSGLDSGYLSSEDLDPPIILFGRTMGLELDIASALGVDYREQAEPDDEKAWHDVREEVLAGRPTMLSGDILYLDYRDYKVHFPGHRFVLVGFDDDSEKAFVADRMRPEHEACSYSALATSRNPPEGMSTKNLWGKFHSTEATCSMVDAARLAIERCATRMLEAETLPLGAEGSGLEMTGGVAGTRRLASELPSWADRRNAQWIAGYAARSIEKFGNGGGYFRRLYAGFLGWARELDESLVAREAPGLATSAADGWTALSDTLFVASEDGAPGDVWAKAAEQASALSDQEARLFEMLADR
jgi:hypothetical protein